MAESTSILPNMRLIGIPSGGTGEDWLQESQKIDAALSDLGMELASESVYLLFDRAPGALAHGEGNCLIARSVIGPKRDPSPPLVLKDWVRAPVHSFDLKGTSLPAIFDEGNEIWQDLQRAGKKVGKGFTVCIRRRLRPELRLETQIIFTE